MNSIMAKYREHSEPLSGFLQVGIGVTITARVADHRLKPAFKLEPAQPIQFLALITGELLIRMVRWDILCRVLGSVHLTVIEAIPQVMKFLAQLVFITMLVKLVLQKEWRQFFNLLALKKDKILVGLTLLIIQTVDIA